MHLDEAEVPALKAELVGFSILREPGSAQCTAALEMSMGAAPGAPGGPSRGSGWEWAVQML